MNSDHSSLLKKIPSMTLLLEEPEFKKLVSRIPESIC